MGVGSSVYNEEGWEKMRLLDGGTKCCGSRILVFVPKFKKLCCPCLSTVFR
jgi:hypothetical protein